MPYLMFIGDEEYCRQNILEMIQDVVVFMSSWMAVSVGLFKCQAGVYYFILKNICSV